MGTVLITGARGFLGRAVTDEFLRRNWYVYALGRSLWPTAPQGVTVIQGDIRHPLPPDLLPWNRLDVVVHLAAAGVKAADRDWFDGLDGNVLGTTHLLEAVATNTRSRIPVLLARSFYENAISEHLSLRQNSYIATKWAAAEVAQSIGRLTGLSLRHAHIFQVYGPGDSPGSVLTYVAGRLKAGLPAELGSGRPPRDWIFLSDAAACLVEIALLKEDLRENYDVGSGILRTVREMAESLASIGGASPDLLRFEANRSRADEKVKLAARSIPDGWKPSVSIENGLRALWNTA